MNILVKYAIIVSFPAFLLAARYFPFERLPTKCGFRSLTDLPCPTCGMTRSVVALGHLDLGRSFQFTPLGPIFVALVALSWFVAIYQISTGRETRLARWVKRRASLLAVIGMCVLFVFGSVRIYLLLTG